MATALELDRQKLDAIVAAICDRLDGDWLLVGGALVALWLEPRRVTEDLDVIGLRGTPAERVALLGLAHDLGLPVEAVNSAADFFVQRIEGWRGMIEPFRSGARGRIFRPNTTLFLLLKTGRLSERDLQDCLAALLHGEPFDRDRVLAALDALEEAPEAHLRQRRAELRGRLAAG